MKNVAASGLWAQSVRVRARADRRVLWATVFCSAAWLSCAGVASAQTDPAYATISIARLFECAPEGPTFCGTIPNAPIVATDTRIGVGGAAHALAMYQGNVAFASADTAGVFALPELAALADTASESRVQGWGWAQGLQRYVWEGETETPLPVVGNLHFNLAGDGFSFVSASIAIIDETLFSTPGLFDTWYRSTGPGDFATGCEESSALAVVNTGILTTGGSRTVDASMGCDGSPLTLATGQEFFVFARLFAFGHRGGDALAHNTFTLDVSAQASPELRASLAENLNVLSNPAAVPEPSSWALMIAGFGAVGGLLRRRKDLVPA